MTTVVITDEPMSLDDLLAVVQGAQVETDDTVRARMVRSRAVVDHALSANDAVYGLTTQVGHGRDTRLTEDEIRSQQMFLIMSHGGGVGPAMTVPLVRAAMAARLNGLARGGSGASPAAADVLVAMLNHAVHPVVPGIGSVGAGDLPLLAGIAQVAVGNGSRRLSGRDPARRRGSRPRRHRTSRTEWQGRPRPHLRERRVDRPRRPRGRERAPTRPGRRRGRRLVDGSAGRQPVDPPPGRRHSQGDPRPDRGDGSPATAPGRRDAGRTRIRALGPGRAVGSGRAPGARGPAPLRCRP